MGNDDNLNIRIYSSGHSTKRQVSLSGAVKHMTFNCRTVDLVDANHVSQDFYMAFN